jgi:predicted nucleic acid-binding Zn ribbon protein
MLCTKCQTDSAHRSHRAGLRDRLASLAGYYPYRCRNCGSRFRGLRKVAPEPSTAARRGVEREIAHTRGARRRKALRRAILLYGGALILFGALLYFLTRVPSMGG